jgi:hypothetical protein
MDYNYYISELSVLIASLERLKRSLEQERDKAAPTHVEYDHSRLNEPPRVKQPNGDEPPKCNCGLPAEFKKSAPQNPKQWAAYFCARPKNDPKNCGFRKWID